MLHETVKELLGYLGADERTQKAVYRHLVPSMEVDGVADFDKVYRRVTGYIDGMSISRWERNFERLDEPRGYDDERDNMSRYAADTETPLDILLQSEGEDEPEHLFSGKDPEDMRYYRTQILAKFPEISERLGYASERMHCGRLLVPRKRIVSVDFGASGVNFVYNSGHPDSVVREAYRLLLEGASVSATGRILGVSTTTILRWKKSSELGVKPKISQTYARMTKFSEDVLRQAALHGMSPDDAARVSGISTRYVKRFWNKIGHDYIPSQVWDMMLSRAGLGLSVSDICRGTGFSDSDFKHYYRGATGEEYKMPAIETSKSAAPKQGRRQPIPEFVNGIINNKGHVTAKDIADFRRTELSTANGLLRRLWRNGRLMRERCGVRFLYYLSESVPR